MRGGSPRSSAPFRRGPTSLHAGSNPWTLAARKGIRRSGAGVSDLQIMPRHTLLNMLTPVIVLISVSVTRVIVLEAALPFLRAWSSPDHPGTQSDDQQGHRDLFSGA